MQILLNRVLVLLFILFFIPASLVRADIVDDINELEKQPKKPDLVPPSTVKTKPNSPADSNFSESNSTGKSPKVVEPKNKKDSKPKSVKDERRKKPIHLQSDGTSTYSQNGALVHLEKNVVITQDDVRIQSDEAKVKLGEKNSDSNVQSVEMKGRVNLNRFSNDPSERITAKGDRAIFNNSEQLVTLEGNARLWRDGHLIRGDKIVYEIETGMVKVDRVQGVVQPDKAKP